MVLGPAILLMLAFSITRRGDGWLALISLAYLAVLAAQILSRWMEFRGGNAKDSMGDPLTAAALRRYVVGAIVLGLSIWVLANLVGNHWPAP
jgi:hypothetical protein